MRLLRDLNNFQTFSIRLLLPQLRGPSKLKHVDGSLNYSTMAPNQIFDRQLKRAQKNRSVLFNPNGELDYLKDEIAARLVDRLLDIKRRFPKVLDIGAGSGHILKQVDKDMMDHLVQLESSDKLLYRDQDKDKDSEVTTERLLADEEFLPFEENTFDAVLSSMSMHWINDLPGALIQARRVLKPDGLFLGCLLGGDTLYELRTSLQLAQVEREGGISPYISPMTSVRDVGALLSRAGFNLTTVDVDEISVSYPSMFELLEDLQGMGENNALIQKKSMIHRDTLLAASAIYKEVYGNKEEDSIPATFQVIYMIGWKPDASQPKPLSPNLQKGGQMM